MEQTDFKNGMGKCQSTAKNGQPCRAPVVRNQRYCFLHLAPNRAAELGRQGGLRNRSQLPTLPADQTLKVPENPADIYLLLKNAFVLTFAGHMSPSQATALAYLANTLTKFQEFDELEARVRALEARNQELLEIQASPRPEVITVVPTPEEFDRAVEENYAKSLTPEDIHDESTGKNLSSDQTTRARTRPENQNGDGAGTKCTK